MTKTDFRVQQAQPAMRYQVNAGTFEQDGRSTGQRFVELKDNLAVQAVVMPTPVALQIASLIIQAVGANLAAEEAERAEAEALIVPAGLRVIH